VGVEDQALRIRCVAGLGNPGPEYAGTRHNVGFMVVDHFATRFGFTWDKSTQWKALTSKQNDLLLVKPMFFMNRSGYSVAAIAQFYKIEPAQVLVVLDDLALPLGRIRVRPAGGTGGHNGLESHRPIWYGRNSAAPSWHWPRAVAGVGRLCARLFF